MQAQRHAQRDSNLLHVKIPHEQGSLQGELRERYGSLPEVLEER